MAHRLPVVDGWTVDCRLREFRRVKWVKASLPGLGAFRDNPNFYTGKEPKMDSVPFDSTKGRKLRRMGMKKFERACG